MAKIEQVSFPEQAPRLKRVVAYARVSSGKDAMLHSLSAQVSAYSEMIRKSVYDHNKVHLTLCP